MFKKGTSGNPKGKPKGTQSKTKQEIRELFNQILSKEIEDIHIALSQMKSDNPKEYVSAILKIIDVLYPTKLGESVTDTTVVFNWCNLDGSPIFDN